MGIYLSALSTVFTTAPGALTSNLVAGLSLVLFIGLAIRNLNRLPDPQRIQHVLTGACLLLVIQLLQMAFSALYLKGFFLTINSMGLVEHLTLALTLIWVSWIFFEEERKFIPTGLAILLSLGVLFLIAISVVLTIINTQISVTASTKLNILWQLGNLILVITGLTLLAFLRPDKWVIGILMLFTLGTGLVIQIFIIDGELGLMGLVRLSLAVSLPWLLTLVSRFTGNKPRERELFECHEEAVDRKPVDTKPELVDQLLQINLQASRLDRAKAVLKALSLSVVADICYLVELPKDAETVKLIAGYDLIREFPLPGATLQRQQLLHIMGAWEEQRILNLTETKSNMRDADTFTLLLKYHRIGSLLAYPLKLPDGPTLGGVILLSPYTSKRWGPETIHLLDKVKETLSKVIFGPDRVETLQDALDQRIEKIDQLRQNYDRLAEVLMEKEENLASLHATIKQLKARYQIEKLESVKQMEALNQEMEVLQGQTATQRQIARQLEQLQVEIRQLTQERDQLRTALARANARIKHLEKQAGQTGPTRLSFDNQIISLDSVAANVRLQVASKLQQADLELEINNPDGRQMIKTDPELLQTVLQGLLENAIAASEYGEVIQLSQSLSLETGMLIAEITDHGEGLTVEEQTALFTTGQKSIPGIGDLTSIRNAIRAIRVLNGKIWLRSKKYDSTTFRVQLPVHIID
jgi:signal transduction histidine kinase